MLCTLDKQKSDSLLHLFFIPTILVECRKGVPVAQTTKSVDSRQKRKTIAPVVSAILEEPETETKQSR